MDTDVIFHFCMSILSL